MKRIRDLRAWIAAIGASATVRSLYFNKIWIYGAALVAFIGVATQVMSIALLGASLLAAAGIAKLWNQLTLTGVTLQRSLDCDRAFPGDVVTLSLTVTNRKAIWIACPA